MTENARPVPADSDTPPSAGAPEVDRTISPIAGRLSGGRASKVVTVAALIAGCGVFMLATGRHPPPKAKAPLQPAQQVVAFEPAKADPQTSPSTAQAPTLAHPGPDAPSLDGPAAAKAATGQVPALQPLTTPAGGASPETLKAEVAQARATLTATIRGAPLIAYSRSDTGPKEALGALAALDPAEKLVQAEARAPSELDQLRQGSTIGQAHAGRLPDRRFLIAAGAAIPCTLVTAMDTATPGYVSCLIGQDVYSDDGGVVLMEKGTKVLGEYHSGLRQGQKRLFVLWTRAVTPSGVTMGLASPASDALGRAGFDGTIDSHFWARFGGALMLSIIDDTASSIAARNDPNGTVTRVPSDAAAVALQNTVNIPPSLTKAQGAEVAIFVAQDLDFSGVYGLKAR